MKTMTVSSAAQACDGVLTCPEAGDVGLGCAVIDSRAVQPGDLFVAYKGEKADGHDYISAAFERGAACCLASRLPEDETRPVILVKDVQQALEKICAAYRRRLDIPVVGITGSVGKTTAKEMISAVLSQRLKVLKTDKNLNNQIGVPMTVSRIESEHEAAVIEMGISDFGEMSRLAMIAQPNIAVFAVIGHAHLEFLRDREGVFRAKTEMLSQMADNAWVIANGDDDMLRAMECRQKKLLYGISEGCDLRAVDIRTRGMSCTECTIVAGERRIRAVIPAYGRHMVYAALEGAAVGLVMGLSDGEIAEGIAAYETVGRRGAVTETGSITLIDDSYNANPDSVMCGIDSMRELEGRKICILGDMLEMGGNSRQMHYDAGAYAAKQGMDIVLTCGELAYAISEGAGEHGRHFESRESLIAALPEIIMPGDRVFVKASRSMHFEKIAEALKEL